MILYAADELTSTAVRKWIKGKQGLCQEETYWCSLRYHQIYRCLKVRAYRQAFESNIFPRIFTYNLLNICVISISVLLLEDAVSFVQRPAVLVVRIWGYSKNFIVPRLVKEELSNMKDSSWMGDKGTTKFKKKKHVSMRKKRQVQGHFTHYQPWSNVDVPWCECVQCDRNSIQDKWWWFRQHRCCLSHSLREGMFRSEWEVKPPYRHLPLQGGHHQKARPHLTWHCNRCKHQWRWLDNMSRINQYDCKRF